MKLIQIKKMPKHCKTHCILNQSLNKKVTCSIGEVECSTRKLNRLQLSLTIERERINYKQADTEIIKQQKKKHLFFLFLFCVCFAEFYHSLDNVYVLTECVVRLSRCLFTVSTPLYWLTNWALLCKWCAASLKTYQYMQEHGKWIAEHWSTHYQHNWHEVYSFRFECVEKCNLDTWKYQ